MLPASCRGAVSGWPPIGGPLKPPCEKICSRAPPAARFPRPPIWPIRWRPCFIGGCCPPLVLHAGPGSLPTDSSGFTRRSAQAGPPISSRPMTVRPMVGESCWRPRVAASKPPRLVGLFTSDELGLAYRGRDCDTHRLPCRTRRRSLDAKMSSDCRVFVRSFLSVGARSLERRDGASWRSGPLLVLEWCRIGFAIR